IPHIQKFSSLWKGIANSLRYLEDCICWILGNGSTTCFWKDPFIPNLGLPINHSSNPVPDWQLNLPAASFVVSNSWNWELVSDLLPQRCLDYLAGVKPPAPEDSADCPSWKFSSNGEFSIKSTYKHISDSINDFSRILKRLTRGMTLDDLCPRCGNAPETIMHMLRDCEVVAELWDSLIDNKNWSAFFSLGIDQWLRTNLHNSANSVSGVPWNYIFPITIWLLWKDKNDLIFQYKTNLPGNLFFLIVSYAGRILYSIASPNPIS
ncbi:ribonuclease H, partial [Sesbania bispinosa]